jgi:hypothetical protein
MYTIGLIKQYITDFPNDQELGKKVRDLILTTDEQLAQFVVISRSTFTNTGENRVDAFFVDEKMAELFVETIKSRRDSVHREYYVFPVMPPF